MEKFVNSLAVAIKSDLQKFSPAILQTNETKTSCLRQQFRRFSTFGPSKNTLTAWNRFVPSYH